MNFANNRLTILRIFKLRAYFEKLIARWSKSSGLLGGQGEMSKLGKIGKVVELVDLGEMGELGELDELSKLTLGPKTRIITRTFC